MTQRSTTAALPAARPTPARKGTTGDSTAVPEDATPAPGPAAVPPVKAPATKPGNAPHGPARRKRW